MSAARPETTGADDAGPPITAYRLGLLGLAVAASASAVLSLSHLRLQETPGCGSAGCAALLKSPWAAVPLLGWPVAFLGGAYFAGLIVAWRATRGNLGRDLRRLMWVGVGASIAFLAAMAAAGTLCPWCLAAHAGHFLLAAGVGLSGRHPPKPRAGLLPFAFAFAGTFFGLALVDRNRAAERGERWEVDRRVSEQAIVDGVASRREEPAGLAGRNRLGPAAAAVRVVIFFDYQCPLCRRLAEQADVARRDAGVSVSVTFRHFPHCRECNPAERGKAADIHPNACRAARAAEAAGVLGGEAGFLAVHRWLMNRTGRFGEVDELRGVVSGAGLDWGDYARAFGSDRVRANVEADAVEAANLGLLSTPMVFVNSVELKGIAAPDALLRTVSAVAAARPPLATAVADRPPTALEKAVADWEDGGQVAIPPGGRAWSRLPTLANPVEVVVWGEYGDAESRALDRWLRARLASRMALRYTFRHLPTTDVADRAARSAEAAAVLGRDFGFRAVHAWLMDRDRPAEVDRLLGELTGFGIDPARFADAMRQPATAAAVRGDREAAASLGLPGPPLLLVDGRWVPRWRVGDDVVLDRILDRAAAARGRSTGRPE